MPACLIHSTTESETADTWNKKLVTGREDGSR